MHRRSLLAGVGPVLASCAAGCLGARADTPQMPPGDPAAGVAPEGLDVQQQNGRCGSSHAATIRVDGDRIVIEGRLLAPTPCHGAAVMNSWRESGSLFITVGPTSQPGGCVQCLGEIPYRITGTPSPMPTRIVVRHESWDTIARVASWGR